MPSRGVRIKLQHKLSQQKGQEMIPTLKVEITGGMHSADEKLAVSTDIG